MAEREAVALPAPPRPRARAGRRRAARSASARRPRPRAAASRSRLISRVVAAAQRLDAADDAGAAAEGDHGDALRRAGLEHRGDRLGVGRQQDGVGRRLELADPQPRSGRGSRCRRRGGAGPRAAVEDVLGARPRSISACGERLRRRAARSRRAPTRSGQRLELAEPLAQHRQRRLVELRRARRVPQPHHFESRRGCPPSSSATASASRSRRAPPRASLPGRAASSASRAARARAAPARRSGSTSVAVALGRAARPRRSELRQVALERRPSISCSQTSARPRSTLSSGSRRARRCPRRSRGPGSSGCAAPLPPLDVLDPHVRGHQRGRL